MNKTDNAHLAPEDIALLQEYLAAMEDISSREPPHLSIETWDIIMAAVQETGEIPAEYRDRVGVSELTVTDEVKNGKYHHTPDGKVTKGYYDINLERWNAESSQIENKYHDIIIKALKFVLLRGIDGDNGEEKTIIELLQQIIENNNENLPSVIVKKLKEIALPRDKVNNNIWSLLEYKEQITNHVFDVANDEDKKKKIIVKVLYSLDFTNLTDAFISRELEPYDKLVYFVVAGLYNAGYYIMSIQQIYSCMGYKGRAGAKDIMKINNSLTKMAFSHLYINNKDEAEKYDYDEFIYDGALLPMERLKAKINGQIVEEAVHVFREPPMMTFARERKHLTTINIELLATPLNKTNENIAIENYLLVEISHMKNPNPKFKRSNKMKYVTICENASIKTTKQRQRAPEKIKKILNHYITCGYIKRFEELKDGVKIVY